MKLYPYQREAIKHIRRMFKRQRWQTSYLLAFDDCEFGMHYIAYSYRAGSYVTLERATARRFPSKAAAEEAKLIASYGSVSADIAKVLRIIKIKEAILG